MVYLHSHGGNRLEGMSLLRYAGLLGINFCFFDFFGHGLSEGDYCTLGVKESEDLDSVLEDLQQNHGMSRFVLWGRSMGAVAAIVSASRNPKNIDYLILDSPFPSIEQVVRDYGARFLKIGEYVALMMFNMVRDEIMDKTKVDLGTFRPIDYCPTLNIPCVFVVAKNDELVIPERVDEMFRNYLCIQRNIVFVEGTHSSARSCIDLDRVVEYLNIFYKYNNRARKIINVPSFKIGQTRNNDFSIQDRVDTEEIKIPKSETFFQGKGSFRNPLKGSQDNSLSRVSIRGPENDLLGLRERRLTGVNHHQIPTEPKIRIDFKQPHQISKQTADKYATFKNLYHSLRLTHPLRNLCRSPTRQNNYY